MAGETYQSAFDELFGAVVYEDHEGDISASVRELGGATTLVISLVRKPWQIIGIGSGESVGEAIASLRHSLGVDIGRIGPEECSSTTEYALSSVRRFVAVGYTNELPKLLARIVVGQASAFLRALQDGE